MLKQKRLVLIFVACFVAIFACRNMDNDGDGYAGVRDCDDTLASVNPSAKENCDDGVDNNCNGKADCEDQICAQEKGCSATSGGSTGGNTGGDGEPNNPSTLTCTQASDCKNAACAGKNLGPNSEPCELPEQNCTDTFDNDGNGQTDCHDAGCHGKPGNSEGALCGEESLAAGNCGDLLDNDADGFTDTQDTKCLG